MNKLIEMMNALRGNCVRVLAYHSISDTPADPFSVSPAQFRAQMEFLRSHHLDAISANALVRACRQGDHLSGKVVITFDDAYENFYTQALPVLTDFDYSATVFIPTGFAGKMSTWSKISPSRLVMDGAQLMQASRRGIELGSHTVNHAALTELSQTDLVNELSASMAFIHQFTGQAEVSLAYPFGMAGDREQAAAKASGYTCAFLADGLWGCSRGSNPYAFPREMVNRDLSMAEFSRRMLGQADLQRLFRNVAHIDHPLTSSAGPGA